MKKYTFYHNGFIFKRIDRKQAKTAYNNGLTVVFCPCNLRPFTAFCFQHNINKHDSGGATFDAVLNRSAFYNCINAETGRYMAFYIPVREVDRFTGGETPTAATLGITDAYDYRYINAKA